MAKKKTTGNEAGGTDPNAWMTTFADLVMLLLTFFVLLLTMSSMDQKALKELFSHLKASTGVLAFSGSRQMEFDKFIKPYTQSDTKLVLDSRVLKDLFLISMERDEKTKDLRKSIHISTDDERGLVMSFEELVLYRPGDATLKTETYAVLDAIQSTIESCANDMLIMGHTDDIPIESRRYGSNWELSLGRGLSVLDYFLKKKGMSPIRFSVGGYGDSRPLFPNDTPAHRASNRRVEIIFKPEKEN